ncbi:MAG: class I SAM-dependent methyltransferase [Azospirillaceae bacterium]|nr:class I SAM-dependent methyltransferase [Azospirillaceae bacterium]
MSLPAPDANNHETVVEHQFGPRAAAYLTSAVHAQGEDLNQLVAIARTRPAARLLDLGCGGGHVGFSVAPHVAEVVAYDLSAAMLDQVAQAARQRGLGNLTTRRGAAEQLPFEDQSFDLVFSRYSAHHWQDVPAALREARRVLRPTGRLVIDDVVAPERPLLDTHLQAFELLRDPSHVRNYSVSQWQALLSTAGFEPDGVMRRRLFLDFASWVERMQTAAVHVAAIRSLQIEVSAEVKAHFDIQADGSFTIDTAVVEASPH